MEKQGNLSEKEFKELFYTKASKVKTKEDLNSFLDEITSYQHDYGTIVYGLMAAMKAAFNYVERSPVGGITGFQAGCIGWECIRKFMMARGPMKLVQYEDLLYPQYESKFEKTIDKKTWDHLQKKAKEKLEEWGASPGAPRVHDHLQKVAGGWVPFGFKVVESE